jgi:hypothetical protein
MSANLIQSYGRAKHFARAESHRAVLLEHLLLGLTEDPDATRVLRVCNVDMARLSADLSAYIRGLPENMRAELGTEPPPDTKIIQVIEAASQAAHQTRRGVDGAIVLAAIVGDAKSPAADLLRQHGMSFETAIRSLQAASAEVGAAALRSATAPSTPSPQQTSVPPPHLPNKTTISVEDILAAARARLLERELRVGKVEPEPSAKPAEMEAVRSPSEELAVSGHPQVIDAADIFLSYARPDKALILQLAATLEERGCTCWFDHFIAGGARFRDTINARLDSARAVVVLWSEHSIKSDWVLYEADRAHKAGKLIPLRLPSLSLDQVPPPFPAVLNVLVWDDEEALLRTLNGFGLPRA